MLRRGSRYSNRWTNTHKERKKERYKDTPAHNTHRADTRAGQMVSG